jgi:tripartite-type tricarboxylate transporter receptor subunit TctC
MEVVVMKKGTKLAGMTMFFMILFMVSLPAFAANFPTKPITLVVPSSAGGTGDLYSRTFASVGEKILRTPFVVVNKPGGAGQVGMQTAFQAGPDGHTLCTASTLESFSTEWEIANGRKPLRTLNDFIPIGSFCLAPYVLVVPFNSPWKSLSDLINDAKAKPGNYSFASNGMYGTSHIFTEMFMKTTGLKFRHVPFQGGGPAAAALVGGHVDWGMTTTGSTMPLVRGNKLRALAVMNNKRYRPIPDIPTAKELGVDTECITFIGLFAHKDTPITIVGKLGEVLKKVTEDESFNKTIETTGEIVHYMSGEDLSKYIESALEKDIRKLYKQLIEEKK